MKSENAWKETNRPLLVSRLRYMKGDKEERLDDKDMTEHLNLEVPEFRFSIRIRLKSDFDGYWNTTLYLGENLQYRY